MNALRLDIRQLILEAYEMTPEDVEGLKHHGIEKGGMMAASAESGKFGEAGKQMIRNMRRAKSRQYSEEQDFDRMELKKLHASKEYRSVIDAFTSGKITAIYDCGYSGTYTQKRGHKGGDMADWFEKYGSNSKDSISTKAFIGSIHEIPKKLARRIQYGFILEGFPVFATRMDAYSQTHSAAPEGLEDFHADSGFVKRGDLTTVIRSMKEWDKETIAEEAVLDNWKITGIVINNVVRDQVYNYEDLGFPVYIIGTTGVMEEL